MILLNTQFLVMLSFRNNDNFILISLLPICIIKTTKNNFAKYDYDFNLK